MNEPAPIVSEFCRMALDDDPSSREINMGTAASLMSMEERARARQAALEMLAHLGAAERAHERMRATLSRQD